MKGKRREGEERAHGRSPKTHLEATQQREPRNSISTFREKSEIFLGER